MTGGSRDTPHLHVALSTGGEYHGCQTTEKRAASPKGAIGLTTLQRLELTRQELRQPGTYGASASWL